LEIIKKIKENIKTIIAIMIVFIIAPIIVGIAIIILNRIYKFDKMDYTKILETLKIWGQSILHNISERISSFFTMKFELWEFIFTLAIFTLAIFVIKILFSKRTRTNEDEDRVLEILLECYNNYYPPSIKVISDKLKLNIAITAQLIDSLRKKDLVEEPNPIMYSDKVLLTTKGRDYALYNAEANS